MKAFDILLAASMIAVPRQAPEPVALAADVRGAVRVSAGSNAEAPLTTLAWLTEGARIQTGRGGSAVIVFWSGKRWRIEAASTGRIADDSVIRISGAVTALEPFPPLPHVASTRTAPGSSYGAVRLRGGAWTLIYPREDVRTRAAETTLIFESDGGVGKYEVEVFDAAGAPVFHTATSESRVTIPAGALQPGTRYSWRAHPAAPGMVDAIGEFTTIGADAEAARTALRAASGTKSAASLAMLAELDSRLGLLAEARAGFDAALALAPKDAALRARVEAFKKLNVPRGP